MPARTDSRFAPEQRDYQIMRLWDHHREILRRLVAGEKAADIARAMDVTPAMVSYVRNSELGQEYLSELHEQADIEAIDIQKRIQKHAPVCQAMLETLMLHPETPIKIRKDIAESQLDRAGFAPVKRSMSAHVSSSDLEDIKRRARESGAISYEEQVQEVQEVQAVAKEELEAPDGNGSE